MYMRKFSQAELLNEAFTDLLKGAVKLAGRGALSAGKGIAKTISPTGYNMVKQAGEAAGKAVAGVALEDPINVLRSMLASSEGKKTIQNGKIGAEKKLNGGYRQVELTGEWISDPTQPPTAFSTSVFLVKNNKNEWTFAGGFDTDGNFIFNNKATRNRNTTTVPMAAQAATPPAAQAAAQAATPPAAQAATPPAAQAAAQAATPPNNQQANTEIGTKVKWQTARGNVREGEIIDNDPSKNIDPATHISIQEPDGKVNIVRKDKVIKESMTHINLIESTKLENIFKFK
jgi:pyruvate/2-oxoglutarate dehydrogenase complex dihydrolipoamide acyltransferase (E2) component